MTCGFQVGGVVAAAAAEFEDGRHRAGRRRLQVVQIEGGFLLVVLRRSEQMKPRRQIAVQPGE